MSTGSQVSLAVLRPAIATLALASLTLAVACGPTAEGRSNPAGNGPTQGNNANVSIAPSDSQPADAGTSSSWTAAVGKPGILSGVMCVTANDCWAGAPPLEHFDGRAWSSRPASEAVGIIQGLACVGTTDCWAVGSYSDKNGANKSLIEQFKAGTWTVVASPDQDTSGVLNGIACPDAKDCWAVGFTSGALNSSQDLVLHFDGSAWSVDAFLGISRATRLSGVDCISVADCWAVGGDNSQGSQSIIAHYDGTSWTVASATPGVPLNAVSCSGANDCWAVGGNNAAGFQPLIQHYDGGSWAVVASPIPDGTTGSFLQGLTCLEKSDCWAVGGYDVPSPVSQQPLIERYDGKSWSIAATSRLGELDFASLSAIACSSSTDCWAVGTDYMGSPYGPYTLIEHWS